MCRGFINRMVMCHSLVGETMVIVSEHFTMACIEHAVLYANSFFLKARQATT